MLRGVFLLPGRFPALAALPAAPGRSSDPPVRGRRAPLSRGRPLVCWFGAVRFTGGPAFFPPALAFAGDI